MTNPDKARLTKGIEKTLNSHGYSFQYSVLREAMRLLVDTKSSEWVAEVPEFPVEVQGYGTRIDFVMKHRRRSLYLVAECKRANPALSNWCFAKATFEPPIDQAKRATIEALRFEKDDQRSTSLEHLHHSNDVYHIGLEIKSDEKGESSSPGRGVIEEACAQVCRGVSGMINHYSFIYDIPEGSVSFFLPVIFTTAKIWVANIDIGSASLADGAVKISENDVQEKQWIFYQYHQSPGLKHSISSRERDKSLDKILYANFVRTIAIVSASGIADFLERSSRWL